MRLGSLAIAAGALVCCLSPTSVKAAETIYTDRTTFLDNSQAITDDEDFESTGAQIRRNLPSLTTPFGTFTNPSSNNIFLAPIGQSNFDLGGAGVTSTVLTASGEDDFLVQLATPLYSLGLDAYTTDFGSTTIRFFAGLSEK